MTSFLKKLFPKKKDAPAAPVTRKENQGKLLPVNNPDTFNKPENISYKDHQTHIDLPQLIVGVAQSIGIQRDHNEDSLFSLTTNLATDERTIDFGLYIIADGMGGHDNGEFASRLALGKFSSHIINTIYKPLITSSDRGLDVSIQEMLQDGILQAHQAVKRESEGGGTTLTAALILGDQVTITHVGDSRAYLLEPERDIKLLTHDHSFVKRLVEIGQITPEQALIHPQRNVLYRALGQGEPFEPDIFSFQLCPDCQLLLCSDGLWGVISDQDMAELLRRISDPQRVCQSLVDSANEAGGPDNISAITIRLTR